MTNRNKIFFVCAFVTMFTGACSSAPSRTAAQTAPTGLETMMSQASADFKAGLTDKALSEYKNITKLYPADKSPWVKLAQIGFDRTNYGDAITNALEALQRDPSDTLANSIVAVSGLRLSTKALANLRKQNNLSGSTRDEAQNLAKILRDTLGESALMRDNRDTTSESDRTANPVKPASSARKKNTPMKATVNGGSQSAKDNADPFGSLK